MGLFAYNMRREEEAKKKALESQTKTESAPKKVEEVKTEKVVTTDSAEKETTTGKQKRTARQ